MSGFELFFNLCLFIFFAPLLIKLAGMFIRMFFSSNGSHVSKPSNKLSYNKGYHGASNSPEPIKSDSQFSESSINPANGTMMNEGMDIYGNPFGIGHDDNEI